MSTTIKIKCIAQTLQIINTPKIASGVQQVNKMQFEFCPTWNGFAKTAIFYRDENEVYNVLLANDECVIPSEVLHDQGRFYFGVFGIKDNLRLTSEVLKYDVVKGSFILGQDPEEPTPSIYEQLLTQYGIIEAKYNEINEVYKNIYGDLAGAVANMPAKGFVNLNTGGEVVRFWVGTKAEHEALEKEEDGVYYVITDIEINNLPCYTITNNVAGSDVDAVLLFCFQQIEKNRPFVINLLQGASIRHRAYLGCSSAQRNPYGSDTINLVLYCIDNGTTIKASILEDEIANLTLDNVDDSVAFTSETYAKASDLTNEIARTTPTTKTSITENGLYSISIQSQAGEQYNVVMYINTSESSYSSSVKFYYRGEYYDVWVHYSNGNVTIEYDGSELGDAFAGTTITRLLGV